MLFSPALSPLIVTAMNFMFVFFLANHKLFITVREKIYHPFDKNMGTTTFEMVSRCLNKDTSCIECKMASIMLTLTNCGRMCLEINSKSLYTHRARTKQRREKEFGCGFTAAEKNKSCQSTKDCTLLL